MLDNEKTYVVEKLIDRRILEGRVEYLVKWQKYPESMATWEPREVLLETIDFAVHKFDAMIDGDISTTLYRSSKSFRN